MNQVSKVRQKINVKIARVGAGWTNKHIPPLKLSSVTVELSVPHEKGGGKKEENKKRNQLFI